MTRRLPLWGFALAFVVQAALLGYMIANRAMLITNGQEIRLSVVPVDPRDFLRGDYVVLSYPQSQLAAAELGGDDAFSYQDPVFVELAQEGDQWKAVALHHAMPEGRMALRGKIENIRWTDNCTGEHCANYSVEYNLEKFFVPEGEGLELEKMRNDKRMEVDVAVGKDGRAALKRLLVDGTVRYEESLL